MITLYWGMEYGKVFLGYLFLMFLWPSVVFYKHLQNKSKVYRFGFCVATQPVIVNTVVLCLGLLHILNRWTLILLFYGAFFIVVWKRLHIGYKDIEQLYRVATGVYGVKSFLLGNIKEWIRKQISSLWKIGKEHFWEYVILFGLLVYGMIYFSWGVFQDYSYGFGDMYVHHKWIYGLIEGIAFSGNVYPEGMHCFVYAIHTLFGIRVYSVLLFLAGIHIITFLLSAYCLMREIFHWRYTPFFALGLFLTLELKSVNEVLSMARFQWTLPQEFGLFTQFICALFLIRYLRAVPHTIQKGKLLKNCWDKNLYIFMMALAASIAIHFYTTIMAFFLCFSIAVFSIKKILTKGHFWPLVAAIIGGFLIAAAPMAGALASGIPFQGSIGWAVSVIGGEDGSNGEENEKEILEDEIEKKEIYENKQYENKIDRNDEVQKKVEEKSFIKRVMHIGISIVNFCKEKMSIIYQMGYISLYGGEQVIWIIGITGFVIIVFLVYQLSAMLLNIPFKGKISPHYFNKHISVFFASFLFMIVYTANNLGLPQLIANVRICSTEQILILMVIVMPIDMIFSLLVLICKDGILQLLSIVCLTACLGAIVKFDYYHGYLLCELTRYNSAVMVTNSIIEMLPQHNYTIISPTDEIYQIIQRGRHEELLTFIQKSEETNYTLPTEYVFIYIEKRPIRYAQYHLFDGPSWLALKKYMPILYEDGHYYNSQCPEVLSSEIFDEKLRKNVEVYSNTFEDYTRLERRTDIESKAYDWCQRFSQLYPFELNVYYEDEDFICYYFRQEPNAPYDLGIG